MPLPGLATAGWKGQRFPLWTKHVEGRLLRCPLPPWNPHPSNQPRTCRHVQQCNSNTSNSFIASLSLGEQLVHRGHPPTPEGARLLFFLWGLCPEAGIHSSSGQAPSSGPTPNPKMTSGPPTGDPDPTAISGASPQTLDWPPCQAGSLTHPQPTGKCLGSAPGGAASGSTECPEGLPVHWGSGQKTCARVCFLVAARQPGHFLETWRCCRQQAWQRRKSQEGHLKKTTSSALQPAHATPAHSNCACPRGKLRGGPGAPVSSAVLCIRKDEILLWVFLGPGLGASRTRSEGMAELPS